MSLIYILRYKCAQIIFLEEIEVEIKLVSKVIIQAFK